MTRTELYAKLAASSEPRDRFALEVPRERFASCANLLMEDCGARLDLMYATDERREHRAFVVHATFSIPKETEFFTLSTRLPEDDPTYPSLTCTIMAASWYERLMADQFGLVAAGHPDPRRLMHHQNMPAGTFPLRKDFAWDAKLIQAEEPYPMQTVAGKGIYEIPVGPIHAGVIEPGHFRFHVRGERILTLEGKLFFTHKGVEKLLEGKTPVAAMPFIEHVSGNMSVAHALAFAQAIEAISGMSVPVRARRLRSFLNELERITMHIFDLGNMAGNGTGFAFVAAQGFRLVEDLRRLSQRLSGHRFLRGLVVPGGLARDWSAAELADVLTSLDRTQTDLHEILAIAYGSDGLMERFETTGILKQEAAIAYGANGLPARASGVDRDERRDHPYAAYATFVPKTILKQDGDVRARFDLRAEEVDESFRLLRLIINDLPEGPVSAIGPIRMGESYGSSEGWLGQVLDWVRLDAQGKIERIVIRDPSFCHWPLFGEIGPGNIVPDFPLCNKSLDLSYSGTDL